MKTKDIKAASKFVAVDRTTGYAYLLEYINKDKAEVSIISKEGLEKLVVVARDSKHTEKFNIIKTPVTNMHSVDPFTKSEFFDTALELTPLIEWRRAGKKNLDEEQIEWLSYAKGKFLLRPYSEVAEILENTWVEYEESNSWAKLITEQIKLRSQ